MASQKQLEKKYQGAQDNADQWYRRAELALQKGDDDLAKEALTRRKAFQVRLCTHAKYFKHDNFRLRHLVCNPWGRRACVGVQQPHI